MNKQTFLNYVKAQHSGKYNMFMDAAKVMNRYRISFEDYLYIIENYSQLQEQYLGKKRTQTEENEPSNTIVEFITNKKA